MKVVISGTKNWSSTNTHTHPHTHSQSHIWREARCLKMSAGLLHTHSIRGTLLYLQTYQEMVAKTKYIRLITDVQCIAPGAWYMAKPSIAISIDESRQRIQLEIGYLSNSRISSFWTKSFWTQNLFGPKKFWTQFFF